MLCSHLPLAAVVAMQTNGPLPCQDGVRQVPSCSEQLTVYGPCNHCSETCNERLGRPATRVGREAKGFPMGEGLSSRGFPVHARPPPAPAVDVRSVCRGAALVVLEPNPEFLQKSILPYTLSPLDFLDFFHLSVS